MLQSVDRTHEKLHLKYNVKGSYYTAYPPSGLWENKYTQQDYVQAITSVLTEYPELPLQLYLHFPYCKKQCHYCQCFQLVTKSTSRMREMRAALCYELEMLNNLFKTLSFKPLFKEIHLGGGSPSYLDEHEFDLIIDKIESFITMGQIEEFAIEIDPRTVSKNKLTHYHKRGINRISFGIQELDPNIQKAINRVQPLEQIEELLELRHLFKGVNFDLLYGLPLQSRASLRNTLEQVVTLSPDRIAFSVLGYRPDVFKHNRKINESELPDLMERIQMWDDSLGIFLKRGYERIGMDHFAKPDDELALAKKNKILFRNSMGYSPGRFRDNISVGPSAMTRLDNYYFQNTYDIHEYCKSVGNQKFPILRGSVLDLDAIIRRDIINEIMTYHNLDIRTLESTYKINFNEYFATELKLFQEMVSEDILIMSSFNIQVTELGKHFLRNVCMMFDNIKLDYKHNIESGIKKI